MTGINLRALKIDVLRRMAQDRWGQTTITQRFSHSQLVRVLEADLLPSFTADEKRMIQNSTIPLAQRQALIEGVIAAALCDRDETDEADEDDAGADTADEMDAMEDAGADTADEMDGETRMRNMIGLLNRWHAAPAKAPPIEAPEAPPL